MYVAFILPGTSLEIKSLLRKRPIQEAHTTPPPPPPNLQNLEDQTNLKTK